VFYFIAGGLCSFAQAQGVLAGEQFAPQNDESRQENSGAFRQID